MGDCQVCDPPQLTIDPKELIGLRNHPRTWTKEGDAQEIQKFLSV